MNRDASEPKLRRVALSTAVTLEVAEQGPRGGTPLLVKPCSSTSTSLRGAGLLRHHSPVHLDQTLALLSAHKPEMERRFAVRSLALFGSRARGQAQAGSDFDLLVEFDGPATSARYFGLQFFLEDLLGGPVDLVTRATVRGLAS